MSTSNDKRFAAIQTIHARLYRLQSVMIEEVKTMKENEIGNLVSDPKFWCNHIESILAEPELLNPQSLVANPTVREKMLEQPMSKGHHNVTSLIEKLPRQKQLKQLSKN